MNYFLKWYNRMAKGFMEHLKSRYCFEKIAIYGAGDYGRQLGNILKNIGVTVSFFCDRDQVKQGRKIDEILCVSLQDMENDRERLLVMVPLYNPDQADEIVQMLYENGFLNVDREYAHALVKLYGIFPVAQDEKLWNEFPPLGHFYSLYPAIEEIQQCKEKLFQEQTAVSDIDFHLPEQLNLLGQMNQLYGDLPDWPGISKTHTDTQYRFRYDNSAFSASDAVGLHTMMRILKPKQVVEVGSGYSSAVLLDTNEYYLENQSRLAFIEPFPQLLESLLKPQDQIELFPRKLQDIPLDFFDRLQAGDILFIDSTHVSKIGSDVNYLFFQILPRLHQGVYIHFHDIFYPFEYPEQWINRGVVWNEIYLLRAFLQNNDAYEIIFFHNMLEKVCMNKLLENWPAQLPVRGGSCWIQKARKK